MTITLRSEKGVSLTYEEMDGNFADYRTHKGYFEFSNLEIGKALAWDGEKFVPYHIEDAVAASGNTTNNLDSVTTRGASTTNVITVGGLLPSADVNGDTPDIGSPTQPFGSIYLNGQTIYLGPNVQLGDAIDGDGNDTRLEITATGIDINGESFVNFIESTNGTIYMQLNANTVIGTQNVATLEDISDAIEALIDAAPETLDTLNELAAAVGDNASFADTITTAVNNRFDLDTHTADDVPEETTNPTNKYFTDARARQAIGIATNSDSNLTYSNTTGLFNFTLGTTNGLPEGSDNSIGQTFDTTGSNDPEAPDYNPNYGQPNADGTNNLYFTNERVDDRVAALLQSAGDISLDYDDANGTLTIGTIAGTQGYDLSSNTTDDLTEGSNFYYTTQRVADYVSENLIAAGNHISLAYVAGKINDITIANAGTLYTTDDTYEGVSLTGGTGSGATADVIVLNGEVTSVTIVNIGEDYLLGDVLSVAAADLGGLDTGGTDVSIEITDISNTLTITGVEDDLSNNNTDDLDEGSDNLYYTSDRANADFDTKLAAATTNDLNEGTGQQTNNRYFTEARARASITLTSDNTNVFDYDDVSGEFTFDLGNVVTDNIDEGTNPTNLWFTDERVDDRVTSLLQEGNMIGLVYDDEANTLTISLTDLDELDTDDLAEGTDNLYYTAQRVSNWFGTNVAQGDNISISLNPETGIYTIAAVEDDLSNNTTDDLTEGSSNLYYTNSRVDTEVNRLLNASDNITLTYVPDRINTVTVTPGSGYNEDDTYTGVALSGGSGSGATADITISGGEVTAVTIVHGGSGYAVDDELTFAAADVGTITGVDQGSVTVASIHAKLDISAVEDNLANNTTNDLDEGTGPGANLYYTDARVGAYLSNNNYATKNYADTQAAAALSSANTYTDDAITSLIDSAPEALDTLNELAAALSDNADFATDISNLIGTKFATADFDSTFDTRLDTKTTNNVTEGSDNSIGETSPGAGDGTNNLYYTDARARAAISVPVGGKLSYVEATGVISYDESDHYTSTDFDTDFGNKSTNDLSEGNVTDTTGSSDPNAPDYNPNYGQQLTDGTNNLYFTAARARAAVGANVSGDLVYDPNTETLSVDTYKTTDFNNDFALRDTDNLSEGTSNLYYKNTRVSTWFQAYVQPGDNVSITNVAPSGSPAVWEISATEDDLSNNTTDDLAEGTNNLYYTAQRVDDQVDSLLVASDNINLTYVTGIIDTVSFNAGTSYTTDGTYNNVALIPLFENTPAGTGAEATIVISGGEVQSVTITDPGTGYAADIFYTIDPADVGGIGTPSLKVMIVITSIRNEIRIAAVEDDLSNNNTDDLAEGTDNLYYTDTRVSTYLTNNNYVTNSSVANSGDWDTAFGWGNHADAGYLTSETSHADVVVDGDFTNPGLMKKNIVDLTGSNDPEAEDYNPNYGLITYTTITDNSANWDTAFSWGDHSSAGYLTSFTESDPVFVAHTVYDIADGTGFLKNDGNGTWTYDNSTYLTSETPDVLTSLQHDPINTTLTYTDEEGVATAIDLSMYIDDTNLARLVNGSLDADGVATFTRDDSTNFTVDFSPLFDNTNLSRIVSATFTLQDTIDTTGSDDPEAEDYNENYGQTIDNAGGTLTLTRGDNTTVTVDLDGRYLLRTEVPTDNNQLNNSAGYITANDIPTSLTAFNNDGNNPYATAADLPTSTDDLTNNSGFITDSDIPTSLSSFTNDSNYVAFYRSATAPQNVAEGDLWMDTTTLDVYTYYNDDGSSVWVQISA